VEFRAYLNEQLPGMPPPMPPGGPAGGAAPPLGKPSGGGPPPTGLPPIGGGGGGPPPPMPNGPQDPSGAMPPTEPVKVKYTDVWELLGKAFGKQVNKKN